ncbi:ATP-dependent Clp protease proteolytic subunit [Sphingomonas sp.]|uniref:ATP-dependent Clp protease proteolytic subunit n=1 Tax=Sphingomonas sp. TaxID=28214 RepID=UPI002E379388|nr:ATP-dependent Clp protease proteolytic subunit [Sphingomonas sp.]HEX4694330.1 ATP-dependent Clp protease proteolytic subunit [Sphingomonas sp.]
MTDSTLQKYPLLATPHIRLRGTVDYAMYQTFCDQLAAAPGDGMLVVSLTTLGGDPEVARAMGDDVRLIREFQRRDILFLGKAAVYSAGATFMATFPVEHRFLTRGTRLMVHERQIDSSVTLSGPLKMQVASLKAKLNEIEHSVNIEEEGFRDLVRGSNVSFEEVRKRAPNNWYIDADEARDLGLVLDVI